MDRDAFPWFRYDSDTLFLDYKRCGTRWVDNQEIVDAMNYAAGRLSAHIAAGNPVIARIRMSWCQIQDDPREILGFFRTIPGIESIDLEGHGHYKGAYESDMTNFTIKWQYDPSKMQKMVNRGSLRGYPFVVRLFKCCDGSEIIFGKKPAQDCGDGPSDDDENGSDSEENGSEAEEVDNEENGSEIESEVESEIEDPSEDEVSETSEDEADLEGEDE